MPNPGWEDLPRRERRRLVREAGGEPQARAIFESQQVAEELLAFGGELAQRFGGGPFGDARPRVESAWAGLTPGYRRRLERAGISRGDYLRGASLGRARGHREPGEAATRRIRGLSRGLTRGQASGRPARGEVGASAIGRTYFGVPVRGPDGTQLLDLTARNAGEASRFGSYLADVGKLLDGRLSAADFEARWQGRRLGGHRVEADANRIMVALAQQALEPGSIRYRRISGAAA